MHNNSVQSPLSSKSIRRSRFDILPENFVQVSSQNPESSLVASELVYDNQQGLGIGYANQTNSLENIAATVTSVPLSSTSASVDLQATKRSRFTDMTQGVSYIPLDSPDTPALAPALSYGSYEITLREKIRLALLKNFEYIIRKDTAPTAPSAIVSREPPLFIPPQAPASSKKPSANTSSSSSSNSEGSSVYATGFPIDFEEEDLNILFSAHGKIRRVKLYRHADGTPKGDALITFQWPAAVIPSCVKLTGLDLGDGCVLRVSKASFEKEGGEVVEEVKQEVDEIVDARLLSQEEGCAEEGKKADEAVVEGSCGVEDVEDFLNSLL